jgi:hypothetical protein
MLCQYYVIVKYRVLPVSSMYVYFQTDREIIDETLSEEQIGGTY